MEKVYTKKEVKKLLKEQREKCANTHKKRLNEYWNTPSTARAEIANIKNAPTPDFD